MTNKKSFPFEATLEKLETIVEKMEQGDMSLEDSLKAFEQGIQLTRSCQKALVEAEQQVQLLLQENGQLQTTEFTVSDDE
ncbi:MAG: exodeoxyribonuclease VII small subunit [Pseudomonadota bacterium]|jgi:exodeoxyribonuclease VII small subunit|nr:exodeoxyribonuclease VII small subunit [Pseudomonadota bacterium]HIG61425.1 exodeoxyribonuclease VII small subunit [Gammaproteobacteria bacterium]HIK68635.1 exodeoxyribonuclease VII small subunit [Pseudomonadales bacterium]